MKNIVILSLLALGYQTASAQLVVEEFGSGLNQFAMEFVTIGNPNNAADMTGNPAPVGSVAYTYSLGKHEVSKDMINKANTLGNLGITLAGAPLSDGPATGMNWLEAAKYVNWLNTSTGGTAAYKFGGNGAFELWSPTDAGYNANNMFRNSLAKYVIASRDEWYKGAFGNPNGTWNNYTTGSDTAPTGVASGTGANTAVFGTSSPASIYNAGGLSGYGTMAQGGNAYEWIESATIDAGNRLNDSATENRDIRGGSYDLPVANTSNIDFSGHSPSADYLYQTTVRVAIVGVPEPSALSLLAIGLGGLALVRRRKQS